MKLKFKKQLNYPVKKKLTELIITEKVEESIPNLEKKIIIISNKSQADKFMRLNMCKFLENVSVKDLYINSAYSITQKQKQFNMYSLLKF